MHLITFYFTAIRIYCFCFKIKKLFSKFSSSKYIAKLYKYFIFIYILSIFKITLKDLQQYVLNSDVCISAEICELIF